MFLLSLVVSWAFGPVCHTRCADSPTKLPAEIPMKFDGGMPSVELMVNGQGPFVFGIDTGAQGGSRIDVSLVEKLGLKASGQVQATDGSGRSPQTAELFKLDDVTIGTVRFSGVTAGSRNLKNSPRPLKVDGILGLSVFSEYLVTVDFPAKLLRFERGELPEPDGAEILDYKGEGGIPLVELAVGDARINAHLDSGNMIGAFILPTAFAEKLTRVSEPVVVGRARSASGEMEIKQVRIKELVKLGRHEFPDATITYPALGEVGNVGVKILSQFALTFDQQHSRLRLTRP
ncbi:MAG: hypothetical protein QOH88_1175 [Verrucomicrobiota bacterium]|jgi:hypothetical protein